ncbi:MAG: aspartyl protease family protein [Dehalococcoidia bacterium]
MGLTTVEVEIGLPNDGDRWESLEFLVDSGAVYSVVPAAVLERLGIKPIAEQVFRLAHGDRIVRRKGIAAFRLGERIGGADVVFGEPGDSNLLGALTLESLGLALDPLRRELRELPMLL